MGNAVACSSKRKETRKQLQNQEFSTERENPPQQQLQIPGVKSQINPQDKNQTEQPSNSFTCLIHKGEPFKAICITSKCTHASNTSRILCSECLIDHTCPQKLRLLDFVNRLRSKLTKEALESFMEIFNDNHSVKTETEKVLRQAIEQISSRFHSVQTNLISQIVSHYHQSQCDLSSKNLNINIIKELELILAGNTPQVGNETIELAITFIQKQDIVEQICLQLERTKSTIAQFANDFQQKFQALLIKFVNCLKFLFELLISPMDFIHEEEAHKTTKKHQRSAGNYLLPKNNNKDKQNKDEKSDKSELQKPVVQTKAHQETEKGGPKKLENQTPELQTKCANHHGEIIAICTSEKCTHQNRKMCADCLIENTSCQNRMRLIEFNIRVCRIITKEVIEDLIIPWAEGTVSSGLRKLLQEGSDILTKLMGDLIQEELKQMFVKYHLIQSAIPNELKIELTKQFFIEFTKMVQEGTIHSGNKSIELAVQFINEQTLIDQFLGAIVKTEQILPQEAEKLQSKILTLTSLFLEDFGKLVELFKTNTDTAIIQKQFQVLIDEPFLIEESIYKLKKDGKFISEWQLSYQFNPLKTTSITDVCMINEQVVSLGCSEGSIIIWNINKQKHLTTLKHGGFVSSLVSLKFNGQSIIISSGFSIDSGCSLATWDLTSKKPNFQFKNAHTDSIRRIKYLYWNPSMATYYKDSTNQSTTINQSAGSSQNVPSQSDISDTEETKQLEQLISCSDDGTIKLWKLSKDLKLEEIILFQQECVLRKKGPCVLDFTILNGCILVAAVIDKTIQISFPFQNTQPFQQLFDDSPVYAISPLENLNTKAMSRKKLHSSAQQRFITGNERGIAIIYSWQNGRAVMLRSLQLHSDKINRINILQSGFIATVSSDKTVVLTLISQSKILARLKGHENSVTSLVFLKEQGSIVTTDQNGEVIVWK